MKRDWEVIRAILVTIENSPTPNVALNAHDLSEYDEQVVAYNMRLLSDAGCIEAKFINLSTGDRKIYAAMVTRLTNSGHDLLDSIKNDGIWEKTKETFISKGVDMTVDLVMMVGRRITESILA